MFKKDAIYITVYGIFLAVGPAAIFCDLLNEWVTQPADDPAVEWRFRVLVASDRARDLCKGPGDYMYVRFVDPEYGCDKWVRGKRTSFRYGQPAAMRDYAPA